MHPLVIYFNVDFHVSLGLASQKIDVTSKKNGDGRYPHGLFDHAYFYTAGGRKFGVAALTRQFFTKIYQMADQDLPVHANYM